MQKLTAKQYNMVDRALGQTGYMSIFDDRRMITSMLRKGFIEKANDDLQGFCYKLTYTGIAAAMCYITNDCTGGIDAEMVRLVNKLNRFTMYAERYS